MKKTDQEINGAAEKYAEDQNSAYTNDYYGFIAGYKQALSDMQAEQPVKNKEVDLEAVTSIIENTLLSSMSGIENEGFVSDCERLSQEVAGALLPHLQPAQESDAVEFALWLESENWEYSIKNNGSYSRLHENRDVTNLYQEFKLNHKQQ